MIAARATAENAMFWAERRVETQTSTACPSSPGWSIAHCSTCIPPSEPPIAACGPLDAEVGEQPAVDGHEVARR